MCKAFSVAKQGGIVIARGKDDARAFVFVVMVSFFVKRRDVVVVVVVVVVVLTRLAMGVVLHQDMLAGVNAEENLDQDKNRQKPDRAKRSATRPKPSVRPCQHCYSPTAGA